MPRRSGTCEYDTPMQHRESTCPPETGIEDGMHIIRKEKRLGTGTGMPL